MWVPRVPAVPGSKRPQGEERPKRKFSILTISAYRVSTIEIYQDLVTEREVTQMNEVKRRKCLLITTLLIPLLVLFIL